MNANASNHSPEPSTIAIDPVLAFPPLPVANNGRVHLGGQAPLFQPAAAENGQVRIGGQAPLFLPAIIADAGLVRLGGQSATF